MKRATKAAGVLVGLLSGVAFVVYALRLGDSLDLSRYANMRAILGIALAAVGSAAIIPISAFAWMRLLHATGEHRRWSELATIMGISQFAKYLPGNIGQHAGRLGMSIHAGIRLTAFTGSVVTESLLAILAAATVGIAGCAFGGIAAMQGFFPGIRVGWIDVGAIAAVLSIVAMVAFAPRWIARPLRHRLKQEHAAVIPSPGSVAVAFAIYILNYLVLGAGLTAMAALVASQPIGLFPVLTGTFAMAWILGFFTPGAPAGLGVREGAMLALLHSAGLGAEAVVIVIAIRIATTVGDLLCFAAANAARLMARRVASNESTAEAHGGTRTQR